MGIDTTVFDNSSFAMLDQRAQSFNNRWFSNQTNVQQTTMSLTERDQSRVFSPQGMEDAPELWQQMVHGHASTGHRLSDSRSSSTDTANAPTPDGNGTDFGNENCHSPNSTCSFTTDDERRYSSEIGTPNSFVDGSIIDPSSPQHFRMTSRNRLPSTSSSTYPYSPYAPEFDDESAIDSPIQNYVVVSAPPCMNRQTSLAIAQEVLRETEFPQDTMFYGELLSASTSPVYDEDSCLPPYPSPSFTEHFNASTASAGLATSQTEDFFAQYYTIECSAVMQCDGSPPASAESSQSLSRSNSNNNNCSNEESNNASTSVEQQDTTAQPEIAINANVGQGTISRNTSELADIFTDSVDIIANNNSLDVYEMMKDCYEGLPEPTQELKTIAVDVIICPEEANDEPSPIVTVKQETVDNVQAIDNRPKKAAKRRGRKPITEEEASTAQIVNENDETNIVKRRDRNNAACRLSRKRRRDKTHEMEENVQRYTSENMDLQMQIENLEVEVKRVRDTILSVMTNRK